MKKLLLAAALGLGTLVGGTLVGVNDVAAYGSPGCVTGSEFQRVTRGMTKRQIDRIFESRGTEKGRSAFTVRFTYKHCRPGLSVNMYYRPSTMRLKSKVLSTIPVPPPPPDDTPGCVTDDEMDQIVPYETHISQVHAIFGTSGTLTLNGIYSYIRDYRPCVPPSSPLSSVEVTYARETSRGSDYVSDIDWGYPG